MGNVISWIGDATHFQMRSITTATQSKKETRRALSLRESDGGMNRDRMVFWNSTRTLSEVLFHHYYSNHYHSQDYGLIFGSLLSRSLHLLSRSLVPPLWIWVHKYYVMFFFCCSFVVRGYFLLVELGNLLENWLSDQTRRLICIAFATTTTTTFKYMHIHYSWKVARTQNCKHIPTSTTTTAMTPGKK